MGQAELNDVFLKVEGIFKKARENFRDPIRDKGSVDENFYEYICYMNNLQTEYSELKEAMEENDETYLCDDRMKSIENEMNSIIDAIDKTKQEA